MDTKKALTAIIILLVLMNITLGVYLIVINSGRGNIEDTLSYTRTILNDRNYRVDCYIPEKPIPLSSVTMGGNRFTEQSLASVMEKTGGTAYIESDSGIMYYISSGETVENPVEINRTVIEATASEFISSIGINREEFTLDYYRETGNDSYELKYMAIDESGNLFFGSYVELTIAGGIVQSARIMYPSVVEIQETQSEGIPVYTILLASLTKSSLEKSIESINSGYYSIKQSTGISNICWRIRFGDGTERFFDADTGEEIK